MMERCYPLRTSKAKALLSRLVLTHPKRSLIEDFFHREDSGHWGEKNLDYYLSFLPQDEYFIFQHLRLKYKQWTFQIDFLLLTAKFALIIEAKNNTGTLTFDGQFHQLIQTLNDKEKCYDDPLAQVKRQQSLLSKWLKKYTSIDIPIHHLVVFSNPNAILKADPTNKEVPKKVCKPFRLLDKIHEIERNNPKEQITLKDIKQTSKLLIKHHEPEQFNILEYFKISPDEVLPGAQCERCDRFPMEYKKGKWYCPSCQTYSKTAHIKAVDDYFYLIKDTMTNSELRNFLLFPTDDITQKYLRKLNLAGSGNTKARVYRKRM